MLPVLCSTTFYVLVLSYTIACGEHNAFANKPCTLFVILVCCFLFYVNVTYTKERYVHGSHLSDYTTIRNGTHTNPKKIACQMKTKI